MSLPYDILHLCCTAVRALNLGIFRSLALKVADQHAMEADGDSFLEPKAQQQKRIPPRLRTAAATALKGGGELRGMHQVLAESGGDKGESYVYDKAGTLTPVGLVYDKAGRHALPVSYPQSGFPEEVLPL